jgi:hypothetical protein
LGLGFRFLGGPGTQRLVRADDARVHLLEQLAQNIGQTWLNSKTLPSNLDRFPVIAKQDPITKTPFVFHAKSGSEYELCATFATDNHEEDATNTPSQWVHPKGDYCFQLDAAKPVPNAPYYYR